MEYKEKFQLSLQEPNAETNPLQHTLNVLSESNPLSQPSRSQAFHVPGRLNFQNNSPHRHILDIALLDSDIKMDNKETTVYVGVGVHKSRAPRCYGDEIMHSSA